MFDVNYMDTRDLVVITLIGLGIFGAASAFLSDQSNTGEKMSTLLKDATGFVVKQFNNNGKSDDLTTVRFRADLYYVTNQRIDFGFEKELDSFYVDYEPQSKFAVNGMIMSSADYGHAEFQDYKGTLSLSDNLTFAGTSGRVLTGPYTFSKDKSVDVSGNSIDFSQVILEKVENQAISLNNVSGNLAMMHDNNAANITLDNKRFVLTFFDGDIKYYKDHAVIEGRGRLDLGFFKAPGE